MVIFLIYSVSLLLSYESIILSSVNLLFASASLFLSDIYLELLAR